MSKKCAKCGKIKHAEEYYPILPALCKICERARKRLEYKLKIKLKK